MAKQHSPALGVDFDGVVHKYSDGWQGGVVYDTPMPGAAEALAELSQYFRLIIFTSRTDLAPVEQWLQDNDLGKYFVEVTNQKPVAAAYLDDRGIRFDGGWDKALSDVKTILKPDAPPGEDTQ